MSLNHSVYVLQVIFKKLAKSKMKKRPTTESVDGSVDDKRKIIIIIAMD